MQNTGLLTCSLFMILVLYNPARSNRSEGNILRSQEPLFRLRLKVFFTGHCEVRAKTRETATSYVCGSEELGPWVDRYSCTLFGDKAGLHISVPSHQLFVGTHFCINARNGPCRRARQYCQANHQELCIT